MGSANRQAGADSQGNSIARSHISEAGLAV